MAKLNNNFLGGKMNKDLDERLVSPSDYRDALNITVGSSEDDNTGSAQNVLGNTLISDLSTVIGSASVNAKTIGAVKVEALNLIYWLVTSDNYDAIIEYNEIYNTTSRVLQCNKPGSALNFSADYIVTGINYVDGYLFWTDNYNPPRKINISRAKSYGINSSQIADDLDVILAPPLYSPKIELKDDGSDSNNLEDKFLYFSYRFKYIDGEYSSFSPFSAVGFEPSTFNLDYEKGNNSAMTNKYNAIDLYFNTGNRNVTDVQLLFKDAKSTSVYIVETLNKEKNNYEDFSEYSFRFKNNKTYLPLTSEQVTRLFDNVPLKAKAQDFVGNRLMYGNYTQFYDIIDSDGEDIKIDYTLEYSSKNTAVDTPIKTFRSDRDYEIGMVYLDDYGRCSSVLTCPTNTVFVPPSESIKGNSIDVTIKHEAPSWATHYRFAIKQSKDEYYNLFPLTFYSDGLFRYFKINKTDIDKFKVGDYLILKADASTPTYSNKKYKVLELEQKEANFLGKNELPGLYFKIKVDSIIDIDGGVIEKIGSSGYGAGVTFKGTNKYNKSLFSGPPQLPANGLTMATRVHYGTGDPNAVSIVGALSSTYKYSRITILATSNTEYKVYIKTLDEDSTTLGQEVSSETISVGTTVVIGQIPFNFKVNTPTLTPGDRYIFNYKGNPDVSYDTGSGYLNAAVINLHPSDTNTPIKKGAIITLQVVTDRLNTVQDFSLQTFKPSPADYINIEEWWFESGAFQEFIFYTSGGTNVGGRAVKFIRGYVGKAKGQNADYENNFITQAVTPDTFTYPLNMVIVSSVDESGTKEQPQLIVNFSLTQSDKEIIFETEGDDNPADIYHEISDTYPVENGNHIVRWSYEDYTFDSSGNTNLGQAVPGTEPTEDSIPHRFNEGDTVHIESKNINGSYIVTKVVDAYNIVIDLSFPGAGPVIPGTISWSDFQRDQTVNTPALVRINNTSTVNSDFNCWAFGNGLESNRIYDDWNEITYKYSPRVNTTTEDYREIESINAICYSGIYGINTSVNKLNEFNLSLANFKYLDINHGSIQRLDSRDSDLLVFQQDKVSRVLYGKNLLFDAVGGGSVASVPEVLGTDIPFYGEYGISNNPESFVRWGSERYFTDARRGAVLKLTGEGLEVVSSKGMNDFFRDDFRDNPNTKKLGSYDPHNKLYILACNDDFVVPCKLSINRDFLSISRNAQSPNLFKITSNSDWNVTLVDDGFGVDWVSLDTLSGSGNSTIRANVSQNNNAVRRTIIVRVTYCNGEIANFTLTQGTASKTDLVNIVYKNNTKLGPNLKKNKE